jgi:hypothetical protein
LRPCSALLLFRDGVSFRLELVWNIAAMNHASNLGEALSIATSFYLIYLRLVAGRATYRPWQGFALPRMKPAARLMAI